MAKGFTHAHRFSCCDSSRDPSNYTVKTLADAANDSLARDMRNSGCLEINADLIEKMNIDMANKKKTKKFDDEAMKKVVASMNFKDDVCALSELGGGATVLSGQTDGRMTNASVTPENIQRDLPELRVVFRSLYNDLMEKSPDDALFETTEFATNDSDLEFDDTASTELKNLFKSTKTKIIKLRARLAELEAGSPRLSGSTGHSQPADDMSCGSDVEPVQDA